MNKKIVIFLFLTILSLTFLSSCHYHTPSLDLATVTEIELLIQETFPVQINVVAKGYLPNPCTHIEQITQRRDGNNFFITIKTKTIQGICIEVITPFTETIPLAVYGLPKGIYHIEVNGIKGTFTMDVDNILLENS
ncbi:MAG TPA: hypothetical protein PLT58_01160 [Atribacterota bacterium]|nr:hypothetical protein [Atribacterota bacterium]